MIKQKHTPMKIFTRIFILLFLLLLNKQSTSQSNYQLQWEYDYTGFTSPWSLDADVLNRPYLYAASGEAGLRIFTTSGVPVYTVDTNMIEMSAMNFTQNGNLLYIAIGRHGNHDAPGLAIVDVTNPSLPVVLDVWVRPFVAESNGAGIVKVEGNYAYLGAMGLGLIILDISTPSNITFVSELALDIDYPVVGPTPSFYNLRGMEVKNSIVYGCFDAGGLRIINCVNKLAPVETGRYANPITYVPFNQPRAYNNIALNDTVAYLAVDYCGVEVLKINDTSNITLLDHFNPVNCPTGSWYGAPVHANELIYNADCKELFVSTAVSEMISMDVSDPTNIDSTGMYGSTSDTTATWGIGMRNDSIYLSYMLIPIYVSWFHPFDAKWNGIKMIKWMNPCAGMGTEENERELLALSIRPNPFNTITQIHFSLDEPLVASIRIVDMMGRTIKYFESQKYNTGENRVDWDGQNFSGNEIADGMYFVRIESADKVFSAKMLKTQ